MTPEQIAKAGTESSHQQAFFCWLQQQTKFDPRLAFAFAIPNGGERNKIVASKLVAEGVKRGVPDTFIPIPVGTYHGLWIEFKKPKSDGKSAGRLSEDQVKWQAYLISQNYCHFVAYDYLQAANAVVRYMSGQEIS